MENGNSYKVEATVPEVVSLLGRIVVPPGTWEATNDLPNACFSTPVCEDHPSNFLSLNIFIILPRGDINSPVQCYNLVHRSLENFPFPHSITEFIIRFTLPWLDQMSWRKQPL